MEDDLTDEATYERVRSRQWRESTPLTRRGLLGASAGAGLAMTAAPAPPARAAVDRPIVKPLPPDLFVRHGTNAEMRWEAMRGQGHLTPTDRFFVRNHVATPEIDAGTWRLRLWGGGLRGSPTLEEAVEFGYQDLLAMRADTMTAFIECTGNGRTFFTSQQGQQVTGTPWGPGAVGVAHWRGVRLSAVLERAGLTPAAVDLMPRGLDAAYTDQGVDMGRVRRPLPVAKALKDVLLAFEMNGRPLPPDHGHPVRLVVPHWVGIASIKWVGDIEVADRPLFSPWNTRYYRLFGPGHPPEGGAPLTRMGVKSAFELPWNARLPADGVQVLHGRSWSGNGRIRHVEVSVDGGRTWSRATPRGPHPSRSWLLWEYRWRCPGPGEYELLARATDETGTAQPDTTPYNTAGYLFDAVVRHPVTLV
ncbi:sulfite oxidase [Thermomonospora umbrina]|uniref:DMSO/TMAO reductase YedYZ molybdopterin-dependent catalytic subunit n=1 Tax=Thermomonospora umbrina TaxID=111806 RepID=A0A3D9T760_9ACTN|nr:sulfite oxidase [Thermomonospora umbrina]REE99611.1 DMSO/TMAO reductase YedYZ molybdopterin-dependent catalytic subunit [Thermomonospora umbrina]